jgi:DNA helicase-2/ATP-dependent DNA helicase PcrA
VELNDNHKKVLDSQGHTLVTGGPGSGKTTIALLKAQARIKEGLNPGESILFLSFSRAAVARIVEASKTNFPEDVRRSISIQTFHSFFWDIIRVFGYLIGAPRTLKILLPHDERSLSNGIEDDDNKWPEWVKERNKLFLDKGLTAFDLFAPKALELLTRSNRIGKIVSTRYPYIIVDEAQDTSEDAWGCIKALATHVPILFLADLEQQIFDFLPGVGPERVSNIENELFPLKVNFGDDNNRSPGMEILRFGNDVLRGEPKTSGYAGVSKMNFNPLAAKRDSSIRKSLGIINQIVRTQTGRSPDNIALLSSYDKGVVIISNALRQGATPIPHKVLFDETLTLLSSRFLAFLLEPKLVLRHEFDLKIGLELLSNIYRSTGNTTDLEKSENIRRWSTMVFASKQPRADLYKGLRKILYHLETIRLTGRPKDDWNTIRNLLRSSGSSDLVRIDESLNYLMTFNRGKKIEQSLSESWTENKCYRNARSLVDVALTEDQIFGGTENTSGIHVMTMHKSKGKQFDAIILYRSEHQSPFKWPRDTDPFLKSRKVLRVGITRARHHVIILNEATSVCPIISSFSLDSAFSK